MDTRANRCTSAKSKMLMAAITATATNTRSMRYDVCDRVMNNPRPLDAPTHSAITAPSTA